MSRSPLGFAALPAAAALLLGGVALTANAAPTTAAECVRDGLVWVHVQYDDTVTGACANEFDTASEALLSTGLTTDTGAWLSTVDGRAADSGAREYWGVWTQSPADGVYSGAWEFAQVGILELTLEAGDVLGVDLEADWDLESAAPTVDPVAGLDLTAPETTPTTPAPSPTPTASASPEGPGSGADCDDPSALPINPECIGAPSTGV
ncbi:hypothetical protein [Tessaracoccus flavus]|uniref:Uncharacterized protein n=1 Tax=Tessaracoccus flavus TaxID=1610493 RepID=A0A1Q2CFE4_9ACTN|nr:hypothetical protein [Tessaracoccus flavus]AQP44828.1 hypothetical protein RPIT_08500 [Tessaracoccus flavus]SDY96369.1 hypothetical protein SAMN05428934_10711 [Tessaracoccus flavus]